MLESVGPWPVHEPENRATGSIFFSFWELCNFFYRRQLSVIAQSWIFSLQKHSGLRCVFYVHALDLSCFILQSAFSWFFLTPTALKHCHKFAVPSVEILQHSKTDFCVHPNDLWHFFQLSSVTRFSTARMVCMKNRALCFDFKSMSIPHSWVRKNSSESTSFHFGPVQRVSKERERRQKLYRCIRTAIHAVPPQGLKVFLLKIATGLRRLRWVTSRWKAWDLSKSASFVWGRDCGVCQPPMMSVFLDVWLCAWLRGYLLLEYYKSIPTHGHRQYRFVVFGNT